MYKVIQMFTDLQDNSHRYEVGDAYPRAGLKVSEERLNELASASNKRGVPLIEEIPEEPKKKATKRTKK